MTDLNRLVDMVLTYEDKNLQMKALSAVPIRDITDRASQRLRAEQKVARELKKNLEEAELYEKYFLHELIDWFRKDYFSWVDVRICKDCDIDMTLVRDCLRQGSSKPSYTYNIEVYECSMCGLVSEFPRYHDANMLLNTKEGRCSEWVQIFTLIVRALGWRARYIYDFTDHEWTEVWSSVTNRWIHCDPCEGLVDCPLVYEVGWGKELTFILAIACDDIQDVTWRYSCNHKSLSARRLPHLEKKYLSKILQIRKRLLANKSTVRRQYVLKGVIAELAELMLEPKPSGSYMGRISGSYSWKETRSELGCQEHKGYIWSPLKSEIEKKEIIIRYCTAKDIYVRDERGKEGIYFGWHNYTFSYRNIFRKEESDWKMTYLAKKDENKTGVVIWKFDLSESNVVIKTIKITCNCFVLNLGSVSWEIECEGYPTVRAENVDYFETSKLENCSCFTLTATLGENLKSNWQHSQLFRQPMDMKFNFPFIVTLTMKSPLRFN